MKMRLIAGSGLVVGLAVIVVFAWRGLAPAPLPVAPTVVPSPTATPLPPPTVPAAVPVPTTTPAPVTILVPSSTPIPPRQPPSVGFGGGGGGGGGGSTEITAAPVSPTATPPTPTPPPPAPTPTVVPEAPELFIEIASLAPLTLFNSTPITVSGKASAPEVDVFVNGISATVTDVNFTVQVPLKEGNNTITAVAEGPFGSLGTDSIQVTLDSTPPTMTISSPADGTVTDADSVTVAGMINDIVVGTVNGNQATVTVNGDPAAVANRSFLTVDVALSTGENTVTATGLDKAGNTASASITVIREEIFGDQIKLAGGNNQEGEIGGLLSSPLVVA